MIMSQRMHSLAHKSVFRNESEEEENYDSIPTRFSKSKPLINKNKKKVKNSNRIISPKSYFRHSTNGQYDRITRSNSIPQLKSNQPVNPFANSKGATSVSLPETNRIDNSGNAGSSLLTHYGDVDSARQSPELNDVVEKMYVGALSPRESHSSVTNFEKKRNFENAQRRGKNISGISRKQNVESTQELSDRRRLKTIVQAVNEAGSDYQKVLEYDDDAPFHEVTSHVLYGETDPIPGYTSYDLISRTLHQIARDGNHKLLSLALERLGTQAYRRINQLDDDSLAPLHYAARYAHSLTVSTLLQKHAKVDIRGQDELTPLHFAARYRRPILSGNKKTRRNQTGGGTTGGGDNEDRLEKAATDDNSLSNDDLEKSLNQDESRASVIRILVENGANINAKDIYGLTSLHYAAMRGNDVAARDLLTYGNIIIDAQDQQMMTPFFLAATFGYTEICKQLIERGADLFAMDESQQTALHRAATGNHVGIVELILSAAMDQGGDSKVVKLLSLRDNERLTPLHVSVLNGHIETTKVLLDEDADVNSVRDTLATPLHAAAVVGDRELLLLLLQYGAYVDPADSNQQTPLHKAAFHNQCEAIKVLLDNNAKISRRDKDSLTPLLLAASAGRAEAIRTLLDRGASVDVVDKDDRTAVFLCAKHGHKDALTVILQSPVSSDLVDLSDRFDNSPLHEAARNGYLDVLLVLLDKGSKADNKNEDEETALHISAKEGQTEVVRELLSRGRPWINDDNEDGNTPLHLASLSGKEDVVMVLLKAGANVDARNTSLWTPLDCAASNGHERVCSLLIKYGSQLDPLDKTKTTPLQLAAQRGHLTVTQILLEKGADVTVLDRSSRNALEIAIASGHRDVAMAIIKSRNWLKALRNIRLDKQERRISPFRLLIQKFPDVAKAALDRCITTNGRDSDQQDYGIKFSYQLIDDTYVVHNLTASETGSIASSSIYFLESPFDEEGKLHPYAEPHTGNARQLKQNHPMSLMVRYRRSELLGHPVVVSLLKHKWKAYTRYVYYINLLLYSIFLFFLTGYVLSSVDWKYALYLVPSKNATANLTSPSCSDLAKAINYEPSSFSSSAKWVIITMAIFSICREVFQFYQARLNYMGLENLLEWVCYVGAILLVFDWGEECAIRQAWQWEVGTVVIFLSWMNLVLFLRKLPLFGIYVVMFTDVLTTFSRFFVVFFLFIVGFALSFYMLFRTTETFQQIGLSFMKTTVMMIGEFDYEALFTELDLPYPVLSNIIFVVFLVVMSLLIMNLLIGLAVDDIKAVQEQAVLKRRAMQTQLIMDVEVLIPDGLRRRFAIPWKKNFPNKKNSVFKRFFYDFSPFQATDVSFSSDQENEVKELRKKIEALSTHINLLKVENEKIANLFTSSVIFNKKRKIGSIREVLSVDS